MKYSAQELIVLFNVSKSGKSMINVSGDTMSVVPKAVWEMAKAGDIESIEMEAGEDLKNEDGTVAFKTMKVKSFSESALARLEKAKRFVAAAEGFDNDKFAAAMATANAITF